MVRSSRLKAALTTLALIAGLPATLALKERQEPSRFDAIAIADPSIVVSPVPVRPDQAEVTSAIRSGWASFKSQNGGAWDVYLDARSGAPLLAQGQGIPFIPGTGNSLQSAAPVTLDSLASSLGDFLAGNAFITRTDKAELMLSREGSGQLTEDLWKVVFERSFSGIPVTGIARKQIGRAHV